MYAIRSYYDGYADRFDYNYAESIHPDKDDPVKLYPGEYSIDGYVCRSYNFV